MAKYQVIDYLMEDSNKPNNQLSELIHLCLETRLAAEAARQAQLEAEEQLLKLRVVKESLKDSGSTSFFDGFLKIVTKLNQKWNQKLLHHIIKNNEWSVMPFEIEYKPVAAHLKVLRDQFPEQYQKLIPALEVSPAKPYFQFSKSAE